MKNFIFTKISKHRIPITVTDNNRYIKSTVVHRQQPGLITKRRQIAGSHKQATEIMYNISINTAIIGYCNFPLKSEDCYKISGSSSSLVGLVLHKRAINDSNVGPLFTVARWRLSSTLLSIIWLSNTGQRYSWTRNGPSTVKLLVMYTSTERHSTSSLVSR